MSEVFIDYRVLMDIWDRVQDGCYTPDTIAKCDSCGTRLFTLSNHEIMAYLQALVDMDWAEWRREGGETEEARGSRKTLCTPKDTPCGSSFAVPQIDNDRMSKAQAALGDAE